jgi:predicted dinucleotide-utilizing enzyme
MTRLGMIGCGTMAGAHIHSLDPLRDRLRFAAFANIDLDRAKKAAETATGAIALTDYHDLLDHVDAVLIALPHDLHFAVGMDCLRARKHVLMEKPLAITEDECLRLIEAHATPAPGVTAEDGRVVIHRSPADAGKAVLAQMSAFLDSIETRRSPEVTAEASFRSLQVIWRLYEAEARGVVADLRGI